MDSDEKTAGAMAIARDPRTIFIYWDAEQTGTDKLTGKPGANIRAVTAWFISASCHDTGDIINCPVDPSAGRFYLHELIPGQTYQIRLCMQDTMGDLHTLIRFAPVTTPSGGFSTVQHQDWTVSLEELKSLLGPEGLQYLGSSDQFYSN